MFDAVQCSDKLIDSFFDVGHSPFQWSFNTVQIKNLCVASSLRVVVEDLDLIGALLLLELLIFLFRFDMQISQRLNVQLDIKVLGHRRSDFSLVKVEAEETTFDAVHKASQGVGNYRPEEVLETDKHAKEDGHSEEHLGDDWILEPTNAVGNQFHTRVSVTLQGGVTRQDVWVRNHQAAEAKMQNNTNGNASSGHDWDPLVEVISSLVALCEE